MTQRRSRSPKKKVMAMMFLRTLTLVLTLALAAIAPAFGDDSALESLAPSSALSDVRASRGVVFVDLYADW